MYAKDGVLTIVKGLMTLEQFFHEWDNVPENVVVAAHFRIRSHGEKNAAMTHPFSIGDDGKLALMHNGVLSGTAATHTSPKSDTCHFVEDTLNHLPQGWETYSAIIDLLAHRIGCGNKMVILRNDGDYTILNKSAGTYEDGVWYSNFSFRPVVVTPARQGTFWDKHDYVPKSGGRVASKYGYSYDPDEDNYIQFPQQGDIAQGVQVFTENSKEIRWDTKSGCWIRLTAQNRGVMLFHYSAPMISFVCDGFISWKALRSKSPKPGEADIAPEDARKHFDIPEHNEPIDLDSHVAASSLVDAELDETTIIAQGP
jgi:hypothetical protein